MEDGMVVILIHINYPYWLYSHPYLLNNDGLNSNEVEDETDDNNN